MTAPVQLGPLSWLPTIEFSRVTDPAARMPAPAVAVPRAMVLLSADNKRQLYVPPGFAHGYLVLSETAEFLYKCSEFYFHKGDRGIAWNDPAVGIRWGLHSPILSAKDKSHPNLSEVPQGELPSFE